MKKNVLRVLMISLLASPLCFQSCSKDFLEAKPKGTDSDGDYYSNETQAMSGLVAVYDVLGWQSDNYVSKMLVMNIASDDVYAGGGASDDQPHLQAISAYRVSPAVGPQDQLWKAGYAGIGRANVLLNRLPSTVMNEQTKKRFIAETRFLRAYFYFDLVRMFKNIPLIKEPLSMNQKNDVEQVSPELIYAFIVTELQEAMADLPASINREQEAGRITRAAGHALLGKVYLYLEKFPEAAAELKAVNGETPGASGPFGNKLLTNFADLWKVSNKHNSESILEINRTSTSAGTWGCISCTEGNVMNIMTAPRDYASKVPGVPDYTSGWGFMVVTKELQSFIKNDRRYHSTVANLDSLRTDSLVFYNNSYQNTGFFIPL